MTVKGSQLIVKLICPYKYENVRKSQKKITKYFDIADVQWITKTSYYAIQKKFLVGVVHLNYCRMNASLVSRLKVEGDVK